MIKNTDIINSFINKDVYSGDVEQDVYYKSGRTRTKNINTRSNA